MSQARVDRTPSSSEPAITNQRSHYLSAGDRVEAKVEADDRRRGVRLDVEALDVEGVNGMHVTMRGVTGRWRGTDVAHVPASLRSCKTPLGRSSDPSEPAPVASSLTSPDVHREPVPETTARGRVGIVDGNAKPFVAGESRSTRAAAKVLAL